MCALRRCRARGIHHPGDSARECGVTARTLRFDEEKGLLTHAATGRERLYSRRDRARLNTS